MNSTARFGLLLVLCSVAGSAYGAENRYRLFDHSDDRTKTGFFLLLEGRDGGPGPLKLDSVRLSLTFGDGRAWHSVDSGYRFRDGAPVTVRAVLNPTGATLYVDGQRAGGVQAPFVPLAASKAKLGDSERWARSGTDYWADQGAYRILVGGKKVSGRVKRAVTGQLALFESPLGQHVSMPAIGQSEVSVETDFRLVAVDHKEYTGAVDRYGQASAARWPGKVTKDEDLHRSRKEELARTRDWKRPDEWDEFGGLKTAPWHETPTGFFRVVKREGVWWMISPRGNPLFYTGMCVTPAVVWDKTPTKGREHIWQELPPKTGPTASIWSTSPWNGAAPGEKDYLFFIGWNLLRKFGPDWERQARADFKRRNDAWGFTGTGKFVETTPGVPYIHTVGLGDVPKLARHPDVFDPAVVEQLRAHLKKDAGARAGDPYVVGFSVENEYEGIITPGEIRTVLEKHPDSPAAKAIRGAVSLSTPPTAEEIEKARQFYGEAYYDCIYKAVKAFAPNQLYFGYWVTPGWWESSADWDMIARHCDVVGYDRYGFRYGGDNGEATNVIAHFDKPTLVGEFSARAWYGGRRGFGRYGTVWAETDAESGDLYAKYVRAAAADPRCVGTLWFQYRDESITGWGNSGANHLVDGEHFAFGFVDVTDRPKWDLITRARKTNLRLTGDRLKLKLKAKE